MSGIIIFGLLLVLMLTGMPISISLGLTVLTFIFGFTHVPVESVALKLFTGIEKFEIMAIPFFILAGNFLTHGGVAKRMINFATSMVGHWHGGLGLAGVLACALFAAVSGSSPATVVAIGSILLPAMVKAGFPNKFGAGIITTSGALGILIPPSIVMVMYSVSTNTSVGALFMAGVIPGLLLAFLLGFTAWWRARKFGYPRMPKSTMAQRVKALRESIWGLLLIVIVMGGIYTGLFTPTEAAAMSAVYAFVIAVFVYKDMGLKDVPRVLLNSANMSAMLLYIITNAVLFSFVLANENIPQQLADWLVNMGLGPIAFLLVVNILLLVAGNFMEPSSIVLIMAPILFPVAMKLGIDPIHFGILIVVNMEVIAVFVYKDMGLKDVPRVLLNSANMSAMLLYIITNAVLFSFVLANENIPQQLADWLVNMGLGPIAFLLVVNILLLVAGNFMEPSSIVLIMAPILFPVAMKLGIDPIHFGILIVVNMEVGMCHPPVGLNLYVASGITKMGITELTIAVWPWLLTMLGFLVLVTYWPPLSLWLPNLLFK